MKAITLTFFHALLDAIVIPTFINMVTVTPVRMRKTGNPYFGRVFKVKTGNYLIAADYETRVQNTEIKETGEFPTFVAQDNKVGTHVSKVRLENKSTGKSYLMHERFDNSIIETVYVFEGQEIDKTRFEHFMTDASDYGNQPIEKKVRVMSVTTSNIKTFTVNGSTYQINS